MRRSFIEAISHRRSNYHLSNNTSISRTELLDTLGTTLAVVPTPFNVQSARLVVLLDHHHTDLWDIVERILQPLTPQDRFLNTQQKINQAFRSGIGTILFYEDEESLDKLREKIPTYAMNVGRWSEQSSGMLQFAIWTALEDMGLGASLQHYNPLIDDAVNREWNINNRWRLIAQMPFGTPLDKPEAHPQTSPIGYRMILHEDNKK